MYIYIYIYIEREREQGREREKEFAQFQSVLQIGGAQIRELGSLREHNSEIKKLKSSGEPQIDRAP